MLHKAKPFMRGKERSLCCVAYFMTNYYQKSNTSEGGIARRGVIQDQILTITTCQKLKRKGEREARGKGD